MCIRDSVQAVFDSYGEKRSPAEWAFRWLCNDPAVYTVLSGVTTPEMTDDNIRIFSNVHPGCMTEEEQEIIKAARETYAKRIKVNCTNCRYCLPCPMGVEIPRVFSAWNNAYKYDTISDVEWTYGRLLADNKSAAQCVGCGKCESICPQHIKIRDMLKSAHEDLTKKA